MKRFANIFGKHVNKKKGGFIRRAGALLCALCLAAAIPVMAMADTMVDPDRTDGSITLQLSYTNAKGVKKSMSGGSIGIFTVAGVKSEDGNQLYDISTGKFADQAVVRDIPGMSESKLNSKNSSIASVLAKKASEDDADQVVSIQNGSVSFKELRPGLYLVMQIEDSKDDVAINPFLISVPYDGAFQISALPKACVKVPDKPETPPPHKPPKTPPERRIPRTGQLWWPVAVGLSAGAVLIVAGILMRKKNQSTAA